LEKEQGTQQRCDLTKGEPMTMDMRKQHADTLARIWFTLKQEHPELTSELFWKQLRRF